MPTEKPKKSNFTPEQDEIINILDQYADTEKKKKLLELSKNIDYARKYGALKVLKKQKEDLLNSILQKIDPKKSSASASSSVKSSGRSEISDEGGFMETQKKEEHEEVQEAEPWIITFADMVSLLMGFFIIMFSMSMVDTEKFKKTISSLKSAFDAPEGQVFDLEKQLKSGQPLKIDTVGGTVNKEIKKIESSVEKFVQDNELHGKVNVTEDSRGVVINIADRMLFPIGKANFFPEIIPILAKLKDVINKFNYQIRVEGHTDDVPIKTPQYPSNWELSASRACELVKFLVENGIPPEKISAEGYAHYRPIIKDTTPEARAKNRRVEIILTREDIYRKVWESNKNKTAGGATSGTDSQLSDKEKENKLIEARLSEEMGGGASGTSTAQVESTTPSAGGH